MALTKAEENYLKAIFKIAERERKSVSTNAIAAELKTSAASVSDMIKKLSDKDLVLYEKYRGVNLSDLGKTLATQLVRKHRLWESFLVDKLHFKWNEVHDIAEELEHIQSLELINRLDAFLGFPRFDPHGDPIPSEEGKFTLRNQVILGELEKGNQAEIVGVREHDDQFLAHLHEMGLVLNKTVRVVDSFPYDGSVLVEVDATQRTVSDKVARNIYVKLV